MAGPTLPAASAQFVDKDGRPTPAFYNWLKTLTQPAMSYLGTVSAATNVLQDTAILAANNGKYRSFLLVAKNIISSAGDNFLLLQWHSGGSFQTSSYLSSYQDTHGSGNSNGSNTSGLMWGFTGTAAPGMSGTLVVSNLANTTAVKQAMMNSCQLDSNVYTINSAGYWNGGNGAIDGFQIVDSSGGNITAGSVDIYGIL